MSQPEPLAPLWKLVERWSKPIFGVKKSDYVEEFHDSSMIKCADELAAALRAWDEEIAKPIEGFCLGPQA